MGIQEFDQARRRLSRGWEIATDRGAAALGQVSVDTVIDPEIASTVNFILSPSSSAAGRAAALGDLLAAYGVGAGVNRRRD